MNTAAKTKIGDLAYIALFAALIAVCSWIAIPGPVSFTLQTFGIFTAVGLLGGKRGTIAVMVYILLGMVGLPVFAGFNGGIGALLGSTGGYIAGFLFSALIMWAIEHFFGSKTPVLLISMIIGSIVCYIFGTIWFVIVYTQNTAPIGFFSALSMCVIPFLIPDTIKILLALFVSKKLKKYIK